MIGIDLLLAILCFVFPRFSIMFLVPGASLTVLQAIALGRRAGRKRFFVWTDLLYDVLIACVVALGSRYYIQAQSYAELNARFEVERLQRQLQSLQNEQTTIAFDRPRLQAELEDSERTASAREARLMECLPKTLVPPARKPAGQIQIDPCAALLALEARHRALPQRISELDRRLEAIPKDIGEVQSTLQRMGDQRPPAPTAPPSTRELELYPMWIPTILLVGTTMKVGKSTSALVDG